VPLKAIEPGRMPALQGKRRRQSNAASVSFTVKTWRIWLACGEGRNACATEKQKSKTPAGGQRYEKRKSEGRWLDVVGHFF